MSLLAPGSSFPSLAGEGLFQGPLSVETGASAAPLSQTVVAYAYTGDYRVDTLLDGLEFRWNYAGAMGSPVTVSYSFMTATPVYGGTDDGEDFGFSPFTAQQRAAVHQIMDRLQAELGITPIEVPDTATSYGQIRFGNNTQLFSSGYAWLPYSTPEAPDRSGDVWIDDSIPQYLTQVAPGTVAYATLIHEIGHALGLKHPGNYNAGTAPSLQPGNYLGGLEDNDNYTVMSYTPALGGQPRDWYGMYDLLALKKLYGSGNFNATDTVYSFTDNDGRVLEIIDDAGGTDTIDISALTADAGRIVDMRPGTFSSVGLNGGRKASKNLSIDFSTVVEKFIGSAYADTVTGNDANNSFVLGTGVNIADGGAGLDMALYGVNRAGYQVAATGSGISVNGTGVTDTLTNIERLSFADSRLAFDADGNAGITAKTLAAVFGPQEVAHPEYVGIGLGFLDKGMSYSDLMLLALDAKLGAGRSNAQVVELLFTNVAGVAPSPAQEAPYLTQLDSGAQTQAQLGIFAADSTYNIAHIDVVGLSHNGLPYV